MTRAVVDQARETLHVARAQLEIVESFASQLTTVEEHALTLLLTQTLTSMASFATLVIVSDEAAIRLCPECGVHPSPAMRAGWHSAACFVCVRPDHGERMHLDAVATDAHAWKRACL